MDAATRQAYLASRAEATFVTSERHEVIDSAERTSPFDFNNAGIIIPDFSIVVPAEYRDRPVSIGFHAPRVFPLSGTVPAQTVWELYRDGVFHRALAWREGRALGIPYGVQGAVLLQPEVVDRTYTVRCGTLVGTTRIFASATELPLLWAEAK